MKWILLEKIRAKDDDYSYVEAFANVGVFTGIRTQESFGKPQIIYAVPWGVDDTGWIQHDIERRYVPEKIAFLMLGEELYSKLVRSANDSIRR